LNDNLTGGRRPSAVGATSRCTVTGHIVDAIEDGRQPSGSCPKKDYDLLILDWMLPTISGVSLCRQYRQSGKTAPVLMLTAKDTILDKVTGLDAGADDYLVKPVDLVELLLGCEHSDGAHPVERRHTAHGRFKLHLTSLTVERAQVTINCQFVSFR